MTEKKMASIMFADIVGYSKMMGMDQSKMLIVLEECKLIIEPIVNRFNGTRIKWIGDEIFCEFPLNEHAADCAVEIQKRLAEYNHSEEDFRILMRIGIHSGEIAITDDDRYGNTVNVASRIEKQAPKGGIAVSGGVYSELKTYPRFNIKKMRSKKLKNIDFKHELYRIQTGYEVRNRKTYYIYLSVIIIAMAILLGYNLINIPINNNNVNIENDQSIDEIPVSALDYLNKANVKKIVAGIINSENANNLLKFLETQRRNGAIKVGNKEDFNDLNNKIVIVLNNNQIVDVLFKYNLKFISIKDNNVMTSLAEKYENLRMIWIHLY